MLQAALFLIQKVKPEKRMVQEMRLLHLPAQSIRIDGVILNHILKDSHGLSVSLPVCGFTKVGGEKEKARLNCEYQFLHFQNYKRRIMAAGMIFWPLCSKFCTRSMMQEFLFI